VVVDPLAEDRGGAMKGYAFAVSCGSCSGPCFPLSVTGQRARHKCRQCGAEWVVTVSVSKPDQPFVWPDPAKAAALHFGEEAMAR